MNVRFGSKADICSAKRHVRFTPNSDVDCDTGECPLWAKSRHPTNHSITSSAVVKSDGGIVRPSDFAVFKLITNSNFAGFTTGRSAGTGVNAHLRPSRDLLDFGGMRLFGLQQRRRSCASEGQFARHSQAVAGAWLASGNTTAPLSKMTNSRRLMTSPEGHDNTLWRLN